MLPLAIILFELTERAGANTAIRGTEQQPVRHSEVSQSDTQRSASHTPRGQPVTPRGQPVTHPEVSQSHTQRHMLQMRDNQTVNKIQSERWCGRGSETGNEVPKKHTVQSVRENQRMSKRNLCLEFLWLDHNNKYK